VHCCIGLYLDFCYIMHACTTLQCDIAKSNLHKESVSVLYVKCFIQYDVALVLTVLLNRCGRPIATSAFLIYLIIQHHEILFRHRPI